MDIANKAKYCFLDIETNGIGSFRPPMQIPIQICYQITSDTGVILETVNEIVTGAIKLSPWSQKNVPITLVQIKKGKSPLSIVTQLYSKLKDSNATVICHNCDFDVGSLINIKFPQIPIKFICLLRSGVSCCKLFRPHGIDWKFPSLLELANKLRLDTNIERLHDALYDVELTRKCFFRLKEIANSESGKITITVKHQLRQPKARNLLESVNYIEKEVLLDVHKNDVKFVKWNISTIKERLGIHTMEYLKIFAKKKGLKGYSNLKKSDLIKALLPIMTVKDFLVVNQELALPPASPPASTFTKQKLILTDSTGNTYEDDDDLVFF